MSLEIVTFGCRLNAFESEAIRAHARAAGLDNAIVVNTCAVTGEAERQARQKIRRLKRENPGARIIVTGCAAQVHKEAFAAMDEVDLVLGNDEKMKAETWRLADPARVLVADIMTVRETAPHLIEGFEGRARAFVEVQQGCDHRCTFCIIPFGRGPNRAVPAERILAQAKKLTAAGYREIALTGVDLASWREGASRIGDLARRLLAETPDLLRLRLSSLDPADFDEALIRLLAEDERLMPHIHLSVQSGDDLILKRMKRRHSTEDLRHLIDRLRKARPGLALGADLIAGFPTEDEGMAENTERLAAELGFSHLHVFPFSPRPGTPAARMRQVPGEIRKARAQRLRELGDRLKRDFMASRLSAPARVLVEEPGFGHDEYYLPVALDGGAPGEILSVLPTEIADGRLTARAADKAAA